MNPNDKIKEVLATYSESRSVKDTARRMGLSYQTIRRILITEGDIPDGRATDVNRMMNEFGMTAQEIAAALHISQKAVRTYLPYSKGRYALTTPSENARRIRACRKKKRENDEARGNFKSPPAGGDDADGTGRTRGYIRTGHERL